MKHVFVETNFLVSLLRPSPDREALDLFDRNDGVGLRLYVPWCSQGEAHRTLTQHIIKADLGFTDSMMKFVVRRWLADPALFDKKEIDKVKHLAEIERRDAMSTLDQRINDHVGCMERIEPTVDVVNRTLRVFAVKSLKPFDEMVLGAVLAKATELWTKGERELFFCELDGDLASQHPPLLQEYASCGLRVLPDFVVPT
jgi:predicted nucleic acid-binding protein